MILLLAVVLTTSIFLPSVQKKIGEVLSNTLSKTLGTTVHIEQIGFDFPNHIYFNDLYVADQQNDTLLYAKKAAVNANFLKLITSGENTEFSAIQLLNLKLRISENTEGKLNCQFIIDSLASDNKNETSEISINKIILRDADLQYKSPKQTLQAKDLHLNAHNISIIGDDISGSLEVNYEDHKLTLDDINYREDLVSIADAHYETGHSVAHIRDLRYDIKTCDISGHVDDTKINPSDWTMFMPCLKDYNMLVWLEGSVTGNNKSLNISQLHLHTQDEAINLKARTLQLTHFTNTTHPDISATNLLLYANRQGLDNITSLPTGKDLKELLAKLQFVKLECDVMTNDQTYNITRGRIESSIGDFYINGTGNARTLDITLTGRDVRVGQIVNEPLLGRSNFSLHVSGGQSKNVSGVIDLLEYKGYPYSNITINGTGNTEGFEGNLLANDANLKASINMSLQLQEKDIILQGTTISLSADKSALYPLLGNDTPSGMSADIIIDNATFTPNNIPQGNMRIEQLFINTATEDYTINDASISIAPNNMTISSNLINANISGAINLNTFLNGLQNQFALHLPSLIKTKTNKDSNYDFDIVIKENENLQRLLTPHDIQLLSDVHLFGHINNDDCKMTAHVETDKIKYKGYNLSALSLDIDNHLTEMIVTSDAIINRDDNDIKTTLSSHIHNDAVNADVSWSSINNNLTNGTLLIASQFTDSIGHLNTTINIQPSTLHYKDREWTIQPSFINFYQDQIICHNVKIQNDDRFIQLNGIASNNPDDIITAKIQGFDVGSLVNLTNFHAVQFDGIVTGSATIKKIFDTPDISAHLLVDAFSLQNCVLGKADINANWDNDLQGAYLTAHIVDQDSIFVQGQWAVPHITDVTGHIAPRSVGRDDVLLNITAQHTNAGFLNSFIGGIFDDIHGDICGPLTVMTAEDNSVNLLGDMSANIGMTLHATNTQYFVDPADTIHFSVDRFDFNDIKIHDTRHQTGVVNGVVTHHNMKNFAYRFDIDINDLTIYDEKDFNSDKFMATAFANGNLSIVGADGNKLQINADITPTRGSSFAYDASTPDAISTNNFITFHDKTTTTTTTTTMTTTAPTPSPSYSSDIFMDINLHVNPNCAIKLKMDSADDGYITTYGTGDLLAHYHNKGPFTLNGTYNISSGKYKLYLQDLIYRDLDLQSGSKVIFNGNPFDANINLLCWHILNAVPLRDLSPSISLQNNKVKAVCELDITGQLNNMNVGFDLHLPNVSDETRQLVKSLISTEEEMNMQMIYLLGLGRFYTSEYARANGETGTGQAMSSLLSSTISGQVNQMLNNVLDNTNWNFGTGLSTGETGWDDLDIEGTLSGRLLHDRLLINGNFGYRDNALTNKANFIGDFDVKYQLKENGNFYVRAYNQTNDKYFTKATLNTQGIGVSYQRNFNAWKELFRRNINKKK